MLHPKTKHKATGLDTHVRLFNKVMCNPDLTLLHKLILSDVISFQIQGKQYFKTSPQLAKELGSYKTKTVQGGFQWLNDNGYLDCLPFATSERLKFDLREARVIQIEKWIYDDAHLHSIGFNLEPLVKKDKNHPLKSLWANRRKKPDVNAVRENTSTVPTKQPTPVENHNWDLYDWNRRDDDDDSELTIGYQPTYSPKPVTVTVDQPVTADEILHINGELLNFGCSLRERVLEEMEAGRIPRYLSAIINIDDHIYEADIVRVDDEYNPHLKYMTRHYIDTNEAW
jgi:hypothetical protein